VEAFKVTMVVTDAQSRPLDRVGRQFVAERPKQLWVADKAEFEAAHDAKQSDPAMVVGFN
jgi:hypothetical protein